jgi:phage FluMu protein Com
MKNLLNNILYGRNGIDELGLFTIWVYIVISLINLFTNSFIGDFSALLLVALILFRMLSKNFTARQKENNVFKKITNFIFKPFENLKRNIKDKEHVYKKCPKCKTVLKLPLPSKKGFQKAKCPKCKKSLTLFTFKQEKIELITNRK